MFDMHPVTSAERRDALIEYVSFFLVCESDFGGDVQDEKNQVMTTNVWVEQVTSPFHRL